MNSKNFSIGTREEADEILNDTKIVSMLSGFGDVRVGGSYYTDLMYGPDIDISIATKDPRKSAIRFLSEIVQKRFFQKYQYGDFEKFPRENRPKAHIVVLILPFRGRQWEIEIWFVKEHSKEQIELEEKLNQLPHEKKAKIIELKAKRDESGMDKHSLSSFDIYKDFI